MPFPQGLESWTFRDCGFPLQFDIRDGLPDRIFPDLNFTAQEVCFMEPDSSINVTQAVPFFGVNDMEASLRFFVEGVGFRMKNSWSPEGKVRWCWLEMGAAAVMLQTFYREGIGPNMPEEKLGVGVTISFQCRDALAIYRDVTSRGIAASRPFVGNGMWVTHMDAPDGYRLEFESPTDQPEETEYSGE
jgi:lactoylglutathione lyase